MINIEKKLINTLSLAQRATKLASGELAVEKAIKTNKAKLVIIATDVSDGTKKKYTDMSQYYQTKLYSILTKEQLGHCIGKEYRAAVAVLDDGFAKSIVKILNP